MPASSIQLTWEPPPPRDLLRWPLPDQNALDRWVLRGLSLLARRQVVAMHGLGFAHPARDPFILALNHSTRAESLLVPALLTLYRDGRVIHFLADWNFRLIPGIGLIYRRAQTISVGNKPAWPRALDALRPLYNRPPNALRRAQAHLLAGHSVGVFPEGRVNRDPERLLAGHRGAAYLSLATGRPIVPAGIRFPAAVPGVPIADRAAMEVRIGAPLVPPAPRGKPSATALRAWHAVIMDDIGRLSGKAWPPPGGAHDAR